MKSKKKRSQKTTQRSDEPACSKLQSPLAMIAVAGLGAAIVIGVVVWLTPLDGPIVSSTSGPRLQGDPPEQASQPNSAASMSPRWELPREAEPVEMESLQDEMLKEAKRLEASHPKSPIALDLCASVYYDLNQLDEADRLWKACLGLKPSQAELYLRYAQFLIGNEKPDEAIQVLESAHASQLETAGTYHELARAYEGAGDLEKAAELSQEVTRRFPEFAESWFLTGKLLNQLGNHAESEANLRRALSLDQSEFDVLPVLVTVLARQGKREEANQLRAKLKTFESAVPTGQEGDAQPFQVRFEESLRSRAARLFFLAAVVEKGVWNTSEMWRLVRRSLKLKPDDSTALIFLAERFVEQKETTEAIEVYKRLIEVQPENMVHFVNLAGLAFRQGDVKFAESVLERGLLVHPQNEVLQVSLAKTYISQKKPLEARELIKKVLEKTPFAEAYMVLGASYQLTGNLDEARAAFEQAQQGTPNPNP